MPYDDSKGQTRLAQSFAFRQLCVSRFRLPESVRKRSSKRYGDAKGVFLCYIGADIRVIEIIYCCAFGEYMIYYHK